MSNDASAWYVIVGVVDKSFDQNQAKELFDSGKIKIRGPYTEDEIKKYYDTGMLKTNNIVLKKGDVTWKPVHSYDDNFIKSLVQNEVFANTISSNNETANPPDPVGEIKSPSKTNISKTNNTHDEKARSHKPLLYCILLLVVAITSIYLYYDIYYCSPREFYKRNKKNIVVIYTEVDGKEKGLGSGFFIANRGFIVTNLHVIAGATSIKVKGGENNLFDVEKVVYIDPNNDLALIKVIGEGIPEGLDLGTPDDLQIGDKIFAIGNPAGLEFSLSEGIVSGIRNEDPITKKRRDMIQITASISPGNSGGPIITKRGKVIGVATLASGTVLQNINFAVPISTIKQIKNFNTTAFKFLSAEPNWVKISSESSLKPTAFTIAYTEYTGTSTDAYYDAISVTDTDAYKKRMWVKAKTNVAVSTYGYSGTVSSAATTEDFISLIEMDCNTSKFRTNSEYFVVNGIVQKNSFDFSEDKEWSDIAPELTELKSQVCILPTEPKVAETQKVQDDLRQRIAELEKVVANDPRNLQAWTMLANDYYDTAQPQKAIDTYAKALELDPGNPNLLADQGVMYKKVGAYDKALANFEKAQRIDPKHLQSLYNIGILYAEDLKQPEKALKYWAHYLELDSTSPAAQQVKRMMAQKKSTAQKGP